MESENSSTTDRPQALQDQTMTKIKTSIDATTYLRAVVRINKDDVSPRVKALVAGIRSLLLDDAHDRYHGISWQVSMINFAKAVSKEFDRAGVVILK